MDKQIKRAFIIGAVILSFASVSWAESSSRQTWFNNLTDKMATFGKDARDKKDIIRSRKEARRQYRSQKKEMHRRKVVRQKKKVREGSYNE